MMMMMNRKVICFKYGSFRWMDSGFGHNVICYEYFNVCNSWTNTSLESSGCLVRTRHSTSVASYRSRGPGFGGMQDAGADALLSCQECRKSLFIFHSILCCVQHKFTSIHTRVVGKLSPNWINIIDRIGNNDMIGLKVAGFPLCDGVISAGHAVIPVLLSLYAISST